MTLRIIISTCLLFFFAATAQADWVLYDDFNGSEISSSKWALTGEAELTLVEGKTKIVYTASPEHSKASMKATAIPSNAMGMRADISVLSGSGKVKARLKLILSPYRTDYEYAAQCFITPPSYSPLVRFSTWYENPNTGSGADTFDGSIQNGGFFQSLGEECTYTIGYDDEANALVGSVDRLVEDHDGSVDDFGTMSFIPVDDLSGTTDHTWAIQVKGYYDDYPDGNITITIDNVYYYIRDSDFHSILNLVSLSD